MPAAPPCKSSIRLKKDRAVWYDGNISAGSTCAERYQKRRDPMDKNVKETVGAYDPVYIPVDGDLYSTLKIGTEDFPFFLSLDNLSEYRDGFANWHKQKEVEISYVTRGAVSVYLTEDEKTFREGEAFVIFPDHLHAVKGVAGEPGQYRTMIFSPRLLYGYENSYWEKSFWNPLTEKPFSLVGIERTGENARILGRIQSIVMEDAEFGTPVGKQRLQRRLQDLWLALFFKRELHLETGHPGEDARAKNMLRYLHEHYQEKFSLSKMAAAMNLSRGECSRYFHRTLGMTISEYLLQYRLGISMRMLREEALSITEIAHAVGFISPSSYTEKFRMQTGMTPRQYRKRG